MNSGNLNRKETVVLLHGVLRKGGSMKPVELTLKRQGYDVLNITYPSNKHSLEELTDFLHTELKLADSYNKAAKVHFVTHSMGGILTRYYLHKYRPHNLGRVVMMGPPNKGSEFADFLTDKKSLRPIFERIYGPAGSQMRTVHNHAKMKIDYDVGVIAGSVSVNPLAPFVLPKGHDGIVPIENTKIDGMKDHIIVSAPHTLMMYNPKVWKQIHSFLQNGRFDHQSPTNTNNNKPSP